MDPMRQEADASAAIDAGGIRARPSWKRFAWINAGNLNSVVPTKRRAENMVKKYGGRVAFVRITEIPEDER